MVMAIAMCLGGREYLDGGMQLVVAARTDEPAGGLALLSGSCLMPLEAWCRWVASSSVVSKPASAPLCVRQQ